jgi:hypothetical protein
MGALSVNHHSESHADLPFVLSVAMENVVSRDYDDTQGDTHTIVHNPAFMTHSQSDRLRVGSKSTRAKSVGWCTHQIHIGNEQCDE